MDDPILDIQNLCKVYDNDHRALDDVSLQIRKGEIFALLGPNGAGKTTLIGAVCGIVRPTSGTIRAFGHEMHRDWREARRRIGLVPQELAVDMFEHVAMAVKHSRGLFGLAPDPAKVEQILKTLSLWDKRDQRISALSGGMKRRVLIAKALAHEPELLFLDEPTAGVDVELRREMWAMIGELRDRGTTIILTTHYIEEAEEMADRVGVIDKGKLLLVEDKHALMARLGKTEAKIVLADRATQLPKGLPEGVSLEDDGRTLVWRGDGDAENDGGVAGLIKALVASGVDFTGVDVHAASLEDIFLELTNEKEAAT